MSNKLYHYTRDGKRESVHTNSKGDHVTEAGQVVNGQVTSNPNAGNKDWSRGRHQDYDPNPFKGLGQGEWDHYAHTADDL